MFIVLFIAPSGLREYMFIYAFALNIYVWIVPQFIELSYVCAAILCCIFFFRFKQLLIFLWIGSPNSNIWSVFDSRYLVRLRENRVPTCINSIDPNLGQWKLSIFLICGVESQDLTASPEKQIWLFVFLWARRIKFPISQCLWGYYII